MGEPFDHVQSLIFKNGQFSPLLTAPIGPIPLANLDFSTPAIQDFPTTATTLAAALGDVAATASHIWGFQESSGNAVDAIAAETLVPTSSPLQGQTAVGLWDGVSYVGANAAEFLNGGTEHFAVGTSGLLNITTGSIAIIVVVRMNSNTALRGLFATRPGGGTGYQVVQLTNGKLQAAAGDGVSTLTVDSSTAIDDGAWHVVALVINRSTDVLHMMTEVGEGTTSIATLGSLTSATDFRLGALSGTNAFPGQIRYMAALTGAAAESLTLAKLQTFWKHASDPTGLLTTQTRVSSISVPVNATEVSHFAANTLPIGFDAGFSDTDKLGLYCNRIDINLVDFSEALSNWTATSVTVVDNASDGPDGMRTASSITATGTNGNAARIFTTVVTTEYTLSIRVKESTIGATGRLIFFDETGATELGSQVFTTTAAWQLVTVTATTNGGQVSSSIRVEVDVNTEVIFASEAQAELGDSFDVYIKTNGATAALTAMNYVATSPRLSVPALGEISATLIRTKFILGTTHFAYILKNSGDDQNRRHILFNTATQIVVTGHDGVGAAEYSFANSISALGVESVLRHVWDESATGVQTGGFEAVLVRNGTGFNAPASPWEGTTGAGTAPDRIEIGTLGGGSNALSGVLQSIKLFDRKNGALP